VPRRVCLWLGLLACLAAGCAESARPKYRIAVIPKGLTHEFWQSIHRGAERAAADLKQEQGLDVQIVWDGPLRERDALAQIRIVDRRISTRVDGIVLAPQHSRTMAAPVERAVEQGIPVVIIDSGLDDGGRGSFVKYVATDNYHGGWLAAEHLLRVLREDGKEAPRIVLFRYQVGSESTEQREKGFEDYVNAEIARQHAAGKPTITWLSNDKYAGATKDSALREAKPLLNNLQDRGIDGIFAPNESSANGMLDALRGLDLIGKVRLMGFDSSEPLLQAVREGDMDGLILQDPYRMGYLGVWILVQYLEGGDVLAPGKDLHTGTVIDPGRLALSTGEYLVTKDNLDAVATRELFDPRLQEQRTMPHPVYPRR
jgi:ribose transport system substrate-binding protein